MALLDGKKLTPTVSSRRTDPAYGAPEAVFDGVNSHLFDLNVETVHGVHTDSFDYTPWLQVDLISPEDVHEVSFVYHGRALGLQVWE